MTLTPSAPSPLPLRVAGLGFAVAGQALLDGVSFTLESGAPTVILGPNGAGKSLLLRLCHGLLAPTAGRIDWSGGDARSQIPVQHVFIPSWLPRTPDQPLRVAVPGTFRNS